MTTAQHDASPALRITATEMSTVFTGAANVHRFDAPSSREIAACVRQVLGPQPEGARVHVAADGARLREIERALSGYDIELSVEELKLHDAAPDPPTDSWEAVEPDRDRAAWVVAAVVAVVAATVAGVLWATVARSAPEPDAAPGPAQAEQSVEESGEDAAEESAEDSGERAPGASISNAAPQTVRLEKDGLSVELPAGFSLDTEADEWRATGDDPNFRLHIAVEQLYQLPAGTMAEQLLADIEADPDIELVDTDGHFVTYLERAADGSQALWRTWPDGSTQLFVGCHTRSEPTTVQRATCRMAMESAEFQKTFATDGTEGANLASNT